MAENELEDDRISHFINEEGLRSDQKIILEILETVETSIKRIGEVKLSLFGSGSISQLVRDVQSLSKAFNDLAKSEKNVAEVSLLQAKTRIANLQAAEKEVQISNKTTAKKTVIVKASQPQASTSAPSELKNEEARVADLSAKYNLLLQKKERLKSEGQIGSGEYTQVIKEIEVYKADIDKATTALELLHEEHARSLSQGNKNLSIGVETQVTVKKANLSGQVSSSDDTVLNKIAEIETLKKSLADVEAQASRIKFNGDFSGTSGEFTKLSNQAADLRISITAATEQLGKYVREQEHAAADGAFDSLNKQAKQLESTIKNLKAQKITGPELDETIAKYEEVNKQLDEIKKSVKEISGIQVKQPKVAVVKEPKPEDDDFTKLRKDAAAAKAEFNSLRTRQLTGDTSVSTDAVEAAKEKWLQLQQTIKMVKIEEKSALSPPKQLSGFEVMVKQAKDAENAYKSLVAQQQAGANISKEKIEEQEKKWLDLKSRITEVQLKQKEAANLTPSNASQDEITGLIVKLRAATHESDELQKKLSLGSKVRAGFGAWSSALSDARKGIKATDQDILKLFNDLAQKSPNVALTIAQRLRFPKTVAPQIQQAATSITGGSTASGTASPSASATAASIQANIAAGEALDSVYARLQQRLVALQTEAQELVSKQLLGLASPTEVARISQVSSELQELQGVIGKVDSATGRAGHNQASYARQFFSLQQVLRETPSLAFGWSTFISAISNNLPILADDISRVNKENKEMAARGEKTTSVWGSLAKSLFSWQTLLLVGISVLAIYADEIKDFVVSLFRTDEANRRAYLSSKKFADAQKAEADIVKDLRDAYAKLADIKNRGNTLGNAQLQGELKVLQATGAALANQLDLKQKIQNLANNQARTQTSTTVDNVSEEIDRRAKGLSLQQEILAKLEADKVKAEKIFNKKTETSTAILPGDPTGQAVTITSQKSKEQQQREKENLQRIKDQIEFQNKIIELDNQAGRFSKQHADEIKKINDDFEAGRIKSHEEANKLIAASDEKFLGLQGQVQNERSDVQNHRQRSLENDAFETKDRLVSKNKDVVKNDTFKAQQQQAAAAKEDAENQGALVKQITDAQQKSLEEQQNQRATINEKEKEASDERHKRVISNAETEAAIIKAANQDILADDRSTLEQRIHAVNELARASRISASAELTEAKRLFKRGELNDADLAEAKNKFNQAITETEIERARQVLNEKQQALERRLEAEKQTEESILGLHIDVNKRIEQNELASLEARGKAQLRAFNDRKKLIEDELRKQLVTNHFTDKEADTFIQSGDFDVKGKSKTFEELKALRVKFENDIKGIVRDSADEQLKIIADELKKEGEVYQDAIDEINKMFDNVDLSQQVSFNIDAKKISEGFAGAEILFKDFTNRRRILEQQSSLQSKATSIARIDQEIKETEQKYSKELEDLKFHNLEMLKAQLEFNQLRLNAIPDDEEHRGERERQQNVVDGLLGAVAKAKSEWEAVKGFGEKILNFKKEKAAKEKEINDDLDKIKADEVQGLEDGISKLASSFQGLLDAQFAARRQQLEDEMALIDERTQKEIDAVTQSIANEDERQKRIREIQERGDQQKKVAEAKEKKLEAEKAKRAKAVAVFGIVLDLASTLAKIALNVAALSSNPLTKGYVPIALAQIPLAIAASALQIATINSTPPPKFQVGVKDFKGGKAILGDAYRSELVEDPSGKMWVTPAAPTEYTLEKGTNVYADARKELSRRVEENLVTNTTENKTVETFVPSPVKPKMVKHELEKPYVPEDSKVAYMLNAQSHIDYAIHLAHHGSAVNVDMSMLGTIDSTMKRGFNTLNRTIKDKPVFEYRSSVRDLIMKHGINWTKHL